ncbi:hypothetical protein AUR64_04745 [Haloprofundus marisrubri]|uniref:Uncharacterized protein n=1 Tax=Haloprofundus marisrubri TaxID=1514971 RepID=A0A0W1RCR7_9EURY|nr:DUF6498-containing protein [Haloprofundus marisrubri]KTG11238.1 hypothetical protein AUR64_04745 [Haloprofundus marisrubri]
MASSTIPERVGSVSDFTGFVPTLLVNLVPLVGLVAFGWEPVTLVVIYAVELSVSILLTSLKAPFAQRRAPADREGVLDVAESELTEKRGRIELVDWLPPVYLRNIPFTTAVFGGFAMLSMFIGVGLASTLDTSGVTFWEVAVGAGSLSLGQLLETKRGYFDTRRYERVSPYSVVETPVREAFFFAFVLFSIPILGALGPGSGVAALGIVVIIKLLVDWSAFRATHSDDGGRLTQWLAGPDEVDRAVEPVDVPAGAPTARASTDRESVAWTGVLGVLFPEAPVYATSFGFLWLAFFAVVGGDNVSRTVVLASLVTVVVLYVLALAVSVGSHYLHYGPMEYRRYDERIVAYDTWLAEPQWSVPVGGFRDVELVDDRLPDRLLATRTFECTTGWGDDEAERYLGPVSNPESFTDEFALSVRTTDLDPMSRPIAATALLVATGLVAAPLVFLVGGASVGDTLTVGMWAALLLLIPYGLWSLAY